jgi:hypothetical protein
VSTCAAGSTRGWSNYGAERSTKSPANGHCCLQTQRGGRLEIFEVMVTASSELFVPLECKPEPIDNPSERVDYFVEMDNFVQKPMTSAS